MTASGSSARAGRSENVVAHKIVERKIVAGKMIDGRSGFTLQAGWGQVSVLKGGGHICLLHLNACSGVNPLWRPPWATIDPFEYTPAKHARRYGPPPDGRLLSGIAGHSKNRKIS